MKFISESERTKQSGSYREIIDSANTSGDISSSCTCVSNEVSQVIICQKKKFKMWGSLCSSVSPLLNGMMMVTVVVIMTSLLQVPKGVAGNPPVRISQQKMVNVSGDFVLGAFFPIHKRGTAMDTCGEIQVSRRSKKKKIV